MSGAFSMAHPEAFRSPGTTAADGSAGLSVDCPIWGQCFRGGPYRLHGHPVGLAHTKKLGQNDSAAAGAVPAGNEVIPAGLVCRAEPFPGCQDPPTSALAKP